MKRASYQSLVPKLRRNRKSPAVWYVRWREQGVRRERILGTLDEYPNLTAAQIAADGLRRNVNSNQFRDVYAEFKDRVTDYACNADQECLLALKQSL
jgi:hypothetical protein